jgi:BRCT domain type II-containing protein
MTHPGSQSVSFIAVPRAHHTTVSKDGSAPLRVNTSTDMSTRSLGLLNFASEVARSLPAHRVTMASFAFDASGRPHVLLTCGYSSTLEMGQMV